MMPNNLQIALLVLKYLFICNEESIVNKRCNLHKLLRRPSWSTKQSPEKPPYYKVALIWMLFSSEYRKCLYSYLGPHVAILLNSTMKHFIGLYYLFKYFL